ncbi:hypothetical protein Cni_G09811 [Canna indica]|uniref:Uncharacterized protein n=1 Tax=Canna indica TaxID=4628 RepID=A0AAQ3K359_9LILI|nr:hypothetical protein Cni_G09811 [Canna indica]
MAALKPPSLSIASFISLNSIDRPLPSPPSHHRQMYLLDAASPKYCSKQGLCFPKLNKKLLYTLSSLLISLLSLIFLLWLTLHPSKPKFYLKDTVVYQLAPAVAPRHASSTPPSRPPSSPATPTHAPASTTTGCAPTPPTRASRSPSTPCCRPSTRATKTSTSSLPPSPGPPCRWRRRSGTRSATTRQPGRCTSISGSTGNFGGRLTAGCRGATESTSTASRS